jgi:hypothetical protein
MEPEILIWDDKTWSEIPEQDNPAFDYIEGERPLGRRGICLMICKVLPYEANSVGEDGYVVIEVPLMGDVTRRGLFWELKDAKIFAEELLTQLNNKTNK